jgi:hypothetical protein
VFLVRKGFEEAIEEELLELYIETLNRELNKP